MGRGTGGIQSPLFFRGAEAVKEGIIIDREKLKMVLGNGYRFEQLLDSGEIERLRREPPAHFPGCAAASLTAGCVRLDAVLYRDRGKLCMGYDLLVKDRPDSPEWICYDSPSDPVSLEESEMLSVLDRAVNESGLSYTQCSFRELEGGPVHKGPELKL